MVNNNTTQLNLLNQGLPGQVKGTISSNCPGCQTNPAAWATNLTLWVNGVRALWIVDPYGNVTWTTDGVRTLKDAMGLFQFTTKPNSQNYGYGWGGSGNFTFIDPGNPDAPG